MAFEDLFVLVDELPVQRTGTPFDATNLSRMYVREYTRKWKVVVTDRYMTPTLVGMAPGLPLYYSSYIPNLLDYDLYALLVKRTAEQDDEDDWQTWTVTDEYSTEIPGGPQDSNNVGPEMEPPDIEYEPFEETSAPATDLANQLFVNTAGDPFVPSFTFPSSDTVLTYTRNELNFDIEKAAGYNYAVNSDSFLGYPPLSVLCLPIRARKMYKGSVNYCRVTYRFRFKAKKLVPLGDDPEVATEEFDFWYPVKILNVGYREKVSGKLLHITDDGTGHAPSHPVLLNADGTKAALDADPIYVERIMHRKRSFSDILVNGVS
jgi:hypothetical protein